MKRLLVLLLALLPAIALAQAPYPAVPPANATLMLQSSSGFVGPSGTHYFGGAGAIGVLSADISAAQAVGWALAGGSGSLPTCSLNQLLYYAANGNTGACLTLGTGLSITTGMINAAGGGMVYPGAGIPVSTGSAWSTSITPGTGVQTALGVAVGSAGAVVVNGGALGTPGSGTATNLTGLPIAGISGLGTGVGTALAVAVGSAGAPVVNGGALGTPSSGVATNLSGTAAALNIGGTAANLSGTPALPNGTTATTQTLADNTTKIATDAFVLANASGGAGTVTDGAGTTTANQFMVSSTTAHAYTVATPSACLNVSSSAVSINAPINAQTGTTYTVLSTDACKLVTLNNASAVAVTLPQATGSFAAGFSFDVQNLGAGLATITPTTSTINGASTLTIPKNTGCTVTSDGTNYQVSACTAIAGTTVTVASGTAALGTSAIASAACATVVTVSASGVATTDAVIAGFNGDVTAVTGYIPSTNGTLTIYAYPTANNVNVKVCNSTSASVTPGAVTLNWRVVR